MTTTLDCASSNIVVVGSNGGVVYCENNTEIQNTVPPKVFTNISSNRSTTTYRIVKQRASARAEAAPIHPIFAEAASKTTDSLWKDVLKRMSRNIYRKGFRFFPASPEENIAGRLTYRVKTKNFDCDISRDPEEALKDVKTFMMNHIGLISDAEQANLDNLIMNYSVNPLDMLPQNWNDVRTESSRNILIRHYVDELREKEGLSAALAMNLMDVISMGVAGEILNSDNIVIRSGAIISIEGIIYDTEHNDYYISPQIFEPRRILHIRKLNQNQGMSSNTEKSVASKKKRGRTPKDKSLENDCENGTSNGIFVASFISPTENFGNTFRNFDQHMSPFSSPGIFSPIQGAFVEGRILASSIYAFCLKVCENYIQSIFRVQNTSNIFETKILSPSDSMNFIDSFVDRLIDINLAPHIAASIAVANALGNKPSIVIVNNSYNRDFDSSSENGIIQIGDIEQFVQNISQCAIDFIEKNKIVNCDDNESLNIPQPIQRLIETVVSFVRKSETDWSLKISKGALKDKKLERQKHINEYVNNVIERMSISKETNAKRQKRTAAFVFSAAERIVRIKNSVTKQSSQEFIGQINPQFGKRRNIVQPVNPTHMFSINGKNDL